MQELNYERLRQAVADRAAAFRCQRTLQPAGGAGTKVFPPTYAGAVYAVERRRVPGRDDPVHCVVLDSVQSQANRMEEALQAAIDDGRIGIPVVEVDFGPFVGGEGGGDGKLLYPIGKITSLQAPHRLADAILRDSELDGKPFRSSDVGRTIDGASNQNATPLYELGPTTLVFGMWDSTGPRGGLGAKFERAIVSEIVGVGCPYSFDADEGKRPKNHGIRRDPLNVSRHASVRMTSQTQWENVEEEGKKKAKDALRPSEINHGNVPFDADNAGITIDHAEQTTTLSLIALRRLRFPGAGGQSSGERDAAAQTVLAALGLCGAALAADEGLDLRSRCLLWPDGAMQWELLAKPGEKPKEFELGADAAVALLAEAVAAAKAVGLTWHDEPLRLRPSAQLVRLVARSQALEAKGQGDAQDGGEG